MNWARWIPRSSRSRLAQIMILVGVTDEDGDKQIAWLAHKILNLRVFEDAQGKMNRSIQDIGGEILSISQFTLFADVHKGNRPSFIKAGKPEHADTHVDQVQRGVALRGSAGEGRSARICGSTGHDGPVTIVIDTETDMPDGSR